MPDGESERMVCSEDPCSAHYICAAFGQRLARPESAVRLRIHMLLRVESMSRHSIEWGARSIDRRRL